LPAIALLPGDIPIGGGRLHHRAVGEILHPELENEAALNSLRESMGPTQFSAQYLQRPVPVDGAFIDPGWFQYYDVPPQRENGSYVIQSWDTASKEGLANSYSACTTWLVQRQSYFLLEVFRGKLNFPALREMALALSRTHKPRHILIEDASTGPALAAELKRHQTAMIKLIKPEQDKRVRLFIQQGKFASGRVWFPKHAPWLRGLLDELLGFPEGRYSDQVDSISQALAYKLDYDPGAIAEVLSELTGSYMTRYAMRNSWGFF
jgi:predicted phage terminase large subunit-like protein